MIGIFNSRLTLVLLLLYGMCCKVSAQADTIRNFALQAAREIMESAGMCALVTQYPGIGPQIRTMDAFAPEQDFTVWLATNPKSRKVQQIHKNKNVVLYYQHRENQGYVSMYGVAELINDQTEKDKRWKPEWKDFYSNRTDAYLLIKVTPLYLEVINYKRNISGDSVTWQPLRVDFKKLSR